MPSGLRTGYLARFTCRIPLGAWCLSVAVSCVRPERAEDPARPGHQIHAAQRPSTAFPASVAWADPHRYVGWFQGLLHDTSEVISDRIQVDGVFEPGCECCHGLVRVIPCPVEPPVHRPLHPPAQRIE
jgi:hypothetical protein